MIKKFIITYLTGIATVALFVQPWYFGELIGLNMNAGNPVLGYCWAVLLEGLTIGLLAAPYLLGKRVLSND